MFKGFENADFIANFSIIFFQNFALFIKELVIFLSKQNKKQNYFCGTYSYKKWSHFSFIHISKIAFSNLLQNY